MPIGKRIARHHWIAARRKRCMTALCPEKRERKAKKGTEKREGERREGEHWHGFPAKLDSKMILES